LKKLLVLIAAFFASFLFLYALVSKDYPARHEGLEAAGLPPLIAVHDLYAASTGSGFDDTGQETSLSEGTKIGWWQSSGVENTVASVLALPPTRSDPGPLPTVVLIRSHPPSGTGRDNERTVRFLTNRGYAVLSIDCGSLTDDSRGPETQTGIYTEGRCTAAGILDETRRLAEQEIADPEAIAVLGSGMGGYLALMTMALEPGLFKAAIVHSPVLDRALPAPENRIELRPQKAVVTNSMEPDESSHDELTSSISSSYDLARSIQGAVLITHGKADTVAPVEYAHALARALFENGTHVETAFFNHEDHAYSRWQTRVQVARMTESFLARCLGGRDGGYDYIELLAKLF